MNIFVCAAGLSEILHARRLTPGGLLGSSACADSQPDDVHGWTLRWGKSGRQSGIAARERSASHQFPNSRESCLLCFDHVADRDRIRSEDCAVVTAVAAKRFTVDEFHRMAEAGVFAEDDRLELLDGEIIQMNPVGRRHVATVNRLTRVLGRVFGDRALISVQNPIVLNPHAEPQPDVVLLRPRDDDYERALPAGTDTYLVVEVSDTTLRYDTTRKVRAYARGGVPALWVVRAPMVRGGKSAVAIGWLSLT